MIDLYIHIGSPKTGTTAIQHFLTGHREALAQQGVLYPMGGVLRAAHHIIGAAIYPGRSSRLGDVSREEALASSIAQIRNEIADLKPHTVVLSTEYLWGKLSSANMRRLLEPFGDMRIHILAYLRRQDLLAQSLYIQAVKGGNVKPFHEWLDHAVEGTKSGFQFDSVLRGWRDCGVPTEIVVRVYEKGQIDDDIRNDFVATVCPQVKLAVAAESANVNATPDMATVELLRVVSACLSDPELANRVRRQLIARSPPRARFAPLTYLGAREVADFMKLFAAGNELVAREFLGRPDGDLFRQPLPSGTEGAAPMDEGFLLRHLIGILPGLVGPGKAGRRSASRPLRGLGKDTAGKKEAVK